MENKLSKIIICWFRNICREMIDEAVQEDFLMEFPIVVFWKESENDYYKNRHSHFKIEEPTD